MIETHLEKTRTHPILVQLSEKKMQNEGLPDGRNWNTKFADFLFKAGQAITYFLGAILLVAGFKHLHLQTHHLVFGVAYWIGLLALCSSFLGFIFSKLWVPLFYEPSKESRFATTEIINNSFVCALGLFLVWGLVKAFTDALALAYPML